MIKRIFHRALTAFISLWLLALSPAVMASQDFDRYIYLDANLGFSFADPFDGSTPSGLSTSDDELAFNLNLGYHFLPYVAIEIGGFLFGTFTAKDKEEDITLEQDVYAVHLSAKGIYNFYDGFDVFAKIGVAGTWLETCAGGLCFEDDVDGVSLLLGAGISYTFLEAFYFTVQWHHLVAVSQTSKSIAGISPGGDNFELDVITFGIGYKFGIT